MDLKKLSLEVIQNSENLAKEFSEEELTYIGTSICDWYTIDKRSRQGWEKKYDEALKLSLQIKEEKSFPWPKAANIKFPLLTIASVQFSARVYPILIKPPDIVKVRKQGADPQGLKASRAHRVQKYMSYQLLEEDEDWEENQDKLFIILPIIGCAFKKTYHDPITDRVCSKLVLPEDLIVHYHTRNLDDAERKTERFKLFPRAIQERVSQGIYCDCDFATPAQKDSGDASKVADVRQGTEEPTGDTDDNIPREILESHCYWDLDGDGYKEPYIVTVDKESTKVLRIVHRFANVITKQSQAIEKLTNQNALLGASIPKQMPQGLQPLQQHQLMAEMEQLHRMMQANAAKIEELKKEKPEVIKIEALEYFTKYSFLPSPDGGFYDLGFGQLLAPLNESVNSIINQLVDAGTLQVGSSGFLGRGARIEGGRIRFQPYEWKHVNVPGGDLKSAIVPLPVNPPSPVLFNLLQLIIQYSERVSSVTEAMSGQDMGQNTPAYNMSAMLEQGLQVFNGVFKRVYRSFRQEIRKIYKLNSLHLDISQYVDTMDGPIEVLQKDFTTSDHDIVPAADPNAFSDMERVQKAAFIAQRAATVPGYSPIGVEMRLLSDMEVPDIQEVYPLDPKGQWVFPPPPNPDIELQKAVEQRKTMDSHTNMQIKGMVAQSEVLLNQANAGLVQAQAEKTGDTGVIERAKLLLDKQQLVHDNLIKMLEAQQSQQEANQTMQMNAQKGAIDMAVAAQKLDHEKEKHAMKMKEMSKKNENASRGGSK